MISFRSRFKTAISLFVMLMAALMLGSANASINGDDIVGTGRAQPGGVASPLNVDEMVQSGAASYSVPIDVPPGRNGMSPQLSINYSSQQGNGWVGVGWNLGVGSISRRTKKGLDYSGNAFDFESGSGSTELEQRGGWGTQVYGTRHGGPDSTKFYRTGSSYESWVVVAPDGTKSYYGSTSDSRQEFAGSGTTEIFKWCLDKVEDTNGNYMEFTYSKNEGEIYLEKIEYTLYSGGDETYTVNFYLQDRTDIRETFNSGHSVKKSKLLKTIEVTCNNNLVRAYTLDYITGNSTKRSLLEKVTQYSHDASVDSLGNVTGGSTLPPVEFEYQNQDFMGVKSVLCSRGNLKTSVNPVECGLGDVNGDGRDDFLFRQVNTRDYMAFLANNSGNLPSLSTTVLRHGVGQIASNTVYEGGIGDFNGDGLSDYILRNSGFQTFYAMLSNGSGFVTPVIWGNRSTINPASSILEDHWADFNGDGKTDYMFRRSGTNEIYVMLSKFTVSGRTTTNISIGDQWCTRPAGVVPANSVPEAGTGDFNGDGKADYCYRAGNTNDFYVMLSTGSSFIHERWYDDRPHGAASVPYEGGYGDFNGDGLTDYMYRPHNTNQLWVMLSNGRGFEDPQEWCDRNPCTPVNPTPCIPPQGYYQGGIGDFNGDGMADYFYRRSGYTQFWVLLSNGSGFTNTYWGDGTAAAPNPTQHGIADLNGDGISDYFCHAYGTNELAMFRTYSVDDSGVTLLRAKTPDLLSKITTGAGATISFKYDTYQRYKGDGNFPLKVHTVKSITMDDGVSDPGTTTFRYSGPKYIIGERSFLGFRQVTKTHPNLNETTTEYNLDGAYYRSLPKTVTVRRDNRQIISLTDYSYLSSTSGSFGYAYLSSKTTKLYDSYAVYSEITETFTRDQNTGMLLTHTTSEDNGPTIRKSLTYTDLGIPSHQKIRTTSETVEENDAGWVQKARTDYQYYNDGTGNLHKKKAWLDGLSDPTVEYQYDAYGNVTSEKDPRGNFSKTIAYDSAINTYPVSETNALGHQTTYSNYDYRYGAPLAVTDPNGQTTGLNTTTVLDAHGRVVEQNFPDGGQVLIEHHDDVFPSYTKTRTLISAGNYSEAYEYRDGFGRTIQTAASDVSGYVASRTEYDNMGRQEHTHGPFHSASHTYPAAIPVQCPGSTTAYDVQGRVASVSTPDVNGYAKSTTYAYNGLSTTVTDPDGAKKTETRDYLGRVIQVMEDPDGLAAVTDYQYDALGNLTQITDDHGNVTQFSYDPLSRKTSMDDPDMGVWTYQYDANGNLTSQEDAKNQTTTFTYDALNRVLTKVNTGGTVTYTYDPAPAVCPNGKGRQHTVTSNGAVDTVNAYDSMGRVLESTRSIPSAGVQKTFQYTYDLAGHQKTVTYPGSPATEIQYDYHPGTSMVHRVTAMDGVNTLAWVELSDYEPTGKPGFVDFYNDAFTEYLYNAYTTRLESIQTVVSNTLAQEFDYTYTDAGDIHTITDQKRSKTYTYAYDALHRLIAETCPGATDNMSITYDNIGNILTKSVGSETLTYAYASNGTANTHKLLTVASDGTPYTMTYDANGNMTQVWDFADASAPVCRAVSYNQSNMPGSISVASGLHTATYGYDGRGARAIKVDLPSGGTETKTLYFSDSFEEVHRYSSGIERNLYMFAGNLRVAKISGTDVKYFHQDHLGSSTLVSDGTGIVPPVKGGLLESTDYRPFGEQRYNPGVSLSPYQYTDQEWEQNTGLYNYDARLYDPVLGRFIAPDSLLPDTLNPQALNRYAYCLNNPLIYTDPTGHETVGEVIQMWGNRMADEGNIGGMVAASIGGAVWDVFGFESVSKVTDNHVSGRVDARASDYGWAAFEVATLGKGGGAVAGIQKFGGKMISKAAPHLDKASQYVKGRVKHLHLDQRGSIPIGMGKGGASDTVWNYVKATQETIARTSIPKSFEIASDAGSFWVHPNATKHMAEYLTRNGLSGSTSAGSQAMLDSFRYAVNEAVATGVKYGEMMQIGRWELMFKEGRVNDVLPVINHALYR